jgi:aryl-alcohol dehydrogenase-like predicted oxidoreductase
MRTLTLPHAGISVSVLCLGAGPLGTRTSRDESFRMLDLYLEHGGNFLDTAHIYAAWVADGWGVSERTIGEWIRLRSVRDQVVIGTKGGHPHLNSMHVSRLAPADIRSDLSESLDRLQVDVIDLYWLHRDDPNRPVDEMLETLHALVGEGKIRAYGCSNWSAARMREAQEYAAAHGMTGFEANQPGWSLAARNANAGGDTTIRFMDEEAYRFHLETNLPVAAYSSQANGFFSGAYGRGILPPAPGVNQGVVSNYYSETNFARLDRARLLAARYNCSANDIALAYLTSQPFPTSAILGCGTLEHLQQSLTASDLLLGKDDLDFLLGD